MRRYGVTLALVALLAGCSGKEHAGSLPSLTTSPTVSAPSPTPADEVANAARHYFAVLEAAGKTGNVADLAALIAPSCECREQVDAIRADARAGRHATTVYRLDAVRTHDVTATTGAATVTVSSPASAVVDSAGRTVRSLPALSGVGIDLVFRRGGNAWLVERVVRL